MSRPNDHWHQLSQSERDEIITLQEGISVIVACPTCGADNNMPIEQWNASLAPVRVPGGTLTVNDIGCAYCGVYLPPAAWHRSHERRLFANQGVTTPRSMKVGDER